MMVPLHFGPGGGPSQTTNTSNKVNSTTTLSSPFDDVPGFKKNSLKRSNIKTKDIDITSDIINNVTSCDPSANHSEGVSNRTSINIDRSKWITFDEHNGSNVGSNNEVKRLSSNVITTPGETLVMSNGTMQHDVKREDANIEVEGVPGSPTRKNWIQFESPAPVAKVDMQLNEEPLSLNCLGDDLPDKKLLGEDLKRESKEIRKSIENLLNAVNKTLTTVKDNITKSSENLDEKSLVVADDDARSELSDEVISLDYESEEENKKLRDTPIKKFTDISLFQASSAGKMENKHEDSNEKSTGSIDECDNVGMRESLDEYPPKILNNTWQFWYRYPDRRKKVGSRSWVKVKVVVEGEFIKLTGTIKNGAEILKEIPLHPFFVFTIPVIHKGDKEGNVHSVKLQYVKYNESRRLQKGKWAAEHLPSYTPVLKIACRNILELKEFIVAVETVIRSIPTYRDKGITYRYEEIFIDCDDDCQFSMTGDGKVLLYNITVQMRMRVFVTGNPELKLFINDMNSKEVLSKTKETLLRETKPSSNWIIPQHLEYHPCVDVQKTQCEGAVIFSPPDGCSFELLRFRVCRKGTLPLACQSSLEILSDNSIRLHASIQVSGDARTIRYKRNNVRLYFPVPPSWANLFVRNRTLRGVKQYIKVKGSKKNSTSVTTATNHVTLQLSAGEATYDPAFGAIVWALGSLPFIHGGLPADATHSFQCSIELSSEYESHDKFKRFAYVEFNIAQAFASGVSIEEVLLSDGRVPDKWVCYRSNYMYKVGLKVIRDGKQVEDIP